MKVSNLLVLVYSSLFSMGWSFQTPPTSPLQGDWQLLSIQLPGSERITDFNGKIAAIRFDTAHNQSSGSTGCNRFSGSYVTVNGQMRFDMEKMALTRMACVGDNERIFLDALKRITHSTIEGQALVMSSGNTVIMRWQKK